MTRIILDIDSVGHASIVEDALTRYVSPTGLESNSGTLDAPWALSKLRNAGVCAPGTTVYLRGGTYTGAFTLAQLGNAAAPIAYINYPGEHVVLDRARAVRDDSLDGLRVEGAYQTIRENTRGTFTILNSNATRELNATDSNKGRPGGIRVASGRGHKLINVRIRDVGNCSWDHPASDTLAYGVIARCVGWDDDSSVANGRGHGYPFYVQNAAGTGRKVFRHCIALNGFGHMVHIFGGSAEKLADVDVDSCTLAMGSACSNRARIAEPWLAAGEAAVNGLAYVDGVTLRRSVVYQRFDYPSDGGINNPALRVGMVQPSGHPAQIHGAVEISDCLVAGALIFQEEDPLLRFRGNRINGMYRPGSPSPPLPVAETWRGSASNVYAGYQAFVAKYNQANVYQADLDAVMPTTVKVEANEYEAGRGHVTIWNWANAPTVNVDLSSVCTAGEDYELFDAENDSVVDSFTYDGNLLPVQMSRASAANPVGGSIRSTRRTGIRFGAFLVRLAQ